jgi:hypothetical protein
VELFIAGTAPTRPDDWYRPVRVDAATGQPATPDTPPDRVVERVYIFPPAEAWEWARENGWPLGPMSALQGSEATGDQHLAASGGLVIISPDPGTVYRLSPAVPATYQSIRVVARPAERVAVVEVTLYADGEPLAVLDAPPFEALWQLVPGEHVFLARGVDSEGRSLRSAPVSIRVLP